MLTKISIRNFKSLDNVEIELGSPVVFIGPNNSGKTSAMQALALWNTGLRRWNEKRMGRSAPEKRPGVTVNRRDLVAIPVSQANLLWSQLRTRDVRRVDGKLSTGNIRIDLIVEGITNDQTWACGLEFDYANDESFYCRPLRSSNANPPDRLPIPKEASSVQIAFLPPMSGLAATETRLDLGAINVRIGEGRTAEVLRNLCFQVYENQPTEWEILTEKIQSLFGATLHPPRYLEERGEIAMTYLEHDVRLDLASAGRGLHQTLLLLAFMYANPGAVILLDEPDAHLEILRQRQIYRLLTEVAHERRSQIIAASHSEVLLNEAANQDMVVAFVGQPHRIDKTKDQVLKALKDIGFEQYYQAKQTGWVLYVEGSSDLSILQAFAKRLGHHAAIKALERPFVHYVQDQPVAVRRHFYGLKEALPELKGIALFDRLEQKELEMGEIEILMWKQREIENYFCSRQTLEAYAKATANEQWAKNSLFELGEVEKRLQAMSGAIDTVESALNALGKESPWGSDLKVSDEFLKPLFAAYFKNLELPNLMGKKSFYELANFVPEEEIDGEISQKLESIVQMART